MIKAQASIEALIALTIVLAFMSLILFSFSQTTELFKEKSSTILKNENNNGCISIANSVCSNSSTKISTKNCSIDLNQSKILCETDFSGNNGVIKNEQHYK